MSNSSSSSFANVDISFIIKNEAANDYVEKAIDLLIENVSGLFNINHETASKLVECVVGLKFDLK